MILGAWRTSRLFYEFDRDSGRYRRRLARFGISLPISGFAATERTREHGRMLFCLYRWDARLVFQAGKRTWELDRPGLAFEFRRLDGGRSSQFTVREGGEVGFQCSYRHWFRSLLSRADVTDDFVDMERDHFLAHVAGRTLPAPDFDKWQDGKPEPPVEEGPGPPSGV